tara:strand:+ start:1275 stop:1652 length:378 start_codon:yes stop_codon:yes gene_type:complete
MTKPEGEEYNRDELINMSNDAITKYMLTDITDLVAFLPCGKSEVGKHKLHNVKSLAELILCNKIKMKQGLKKKWYDEGSPAERVALYKLLASEDEIKVLNGKSESITDQKRTGPRGVYSARTKGA